MTVSLYEDHPLTDLDRKRILACLVNLRMICDSTYLFDKATRVSPKLDEFAGTLDEKIVDAFLEAIGPLRSTPPTP